MEEIKHRQMALFSECLKKQELVRKKQGRLKNINVRGNEKLESLSSLRGGEFFFFMLDFGGGIVYTELISIFFLS